MSLFLYFFFDSRLLPWAFYLGSWALQVSGHQTGEGLSLLPVSSSGTRSEFGRLSYGMFYMYAFFPGVLVPAEGFNVQMFLVLCTYTLLTTFFSHSGFSSFLGSRSLCWNTTSCRSTSSLVRADDMCVFEN